MGVAPFGVDETLNKLDNLTSRFNDMVVETIVTWLRTSVIPRAQTKAPVKTGNLRSSLDIIVIERNGNTAAFIVGWGNQAPYGRFQERGWLSHEGKRFIENAAKESAPELPRLFIYQISLESIHGQTVTKVKI